MRALLPCLALVLAFGCDDDPEPAVDDAPPTEGAAEEAPAEPTPPSPGADEGEEDPLAGLDDPEALAAEVPAGALPAVSAESVEAAAPERGCATFGEQPLRVWTRPGPAHVVAVGEDGFALAGYAANAAGDGEEVWLLTASPTRAPRPVLREDLPHALSVPRVAGPGLGRMDDGHVGLVTLDGAADARFTIVQLGGRRAPWRELGPHADQRFAPAIGLRGGRHAVAWTEGTEEGQRVHYAAFDPTGRELARHDLTQESMGAAAPVFADGATEDLIFIDPREATSVLYRADLTTDPPPVEVLRPVSSVYDPAALAPVVLGERALIGYTAVGMAAATAVGLVWKEGESASAPQALVPSEGYGALHVSAAAAEGRAVFAADHPKGRERGAAREVWVRVVEPTEGGATLGEPLTLAAPDGTGRWAHLARHPSGTYALVFTAGDGVYLHFLRCDDAG